MLDTARLLEVFNTLDQKTLASLSICTLNSPSSPYRCADEQFTVVHQAPVVQSVYDTIHQMSNYSVGSVFCFANTYPLNSDLSCR